MRGRKSAERRRCRRADALGAGPLCELIGRSASGRPGAGPGSRLKARAGAACAGGLALLAGCATGPVASAQSIPPAAAADVVPIGAPVDDRLVAPVAGVDGDVDADGDADGDGDGVPDSLDACARSQVVAAVDAGGCSPFDGVLDGVNFAMNGAALDDQARAALQPLIDALEAYPDVVLELQGHTDNRGPAGGNLVLSKRRVMAVVRFLVSEGIEPSRLQPWGYGENRPIVSNATAEGRARNRRIEVRAIMPSKETE